jgi:intein/homing endonuclease
MKHRAYTSEEVKFLLQNYSTMSVKNCARKLGRSEIAIINKANDLKLRSNKTLHWKTAKGRIKPIEDCKLTNLDFLKLDTPTRCYLLGLLWADGYLSSDNKKSLFMYLKESDMLCLKSLIKSVLPVTFYSRNVKGRKPQICMYIYSSHLTKKLISDFQFSEKSNKIFIPKKIKGELLKYFLRGYIDGDGCFSISDCKRTGRASFSVPSFNICSTYHYDWSELEDIAKEMNIYYRIYRYKSKKKKSSFSRFIICRQSDMIIWIDYLYSGKFNGIGLKRKFDVAMKIKSYINRPK